MEVLSPQQILNFFSKQKKRSRHEVKETFEAIQLDFGGIIPNTLCGGAGKVGEENTAVGCFNFHLAA